MNKDCILIGHGAGGRMSQELIKDIFLKSYGNQTLNKLGDASLIQPAGTLAFTTDSFVVDPIFFPGGNIGTLAISGTVNDLIVSGAEPLFLTAGFIIEEGFLIRDLELIVASMNEEALAAGVQVVAGDTKVVAKGQCDKIFINTSGIGQLINQSLDEHPIETGDQIIATGNLGDHAIAILGAREGLSFEEAILSDAAPLNKMLHPIWVEFGSDIRLMRDITRGGLATVMNELTNGQAFGAMLQESQLPVQESVKGICELYGYDPIYLANEGKALIIASKEAAGEIVKSLKGHELGKEACIIGEIMEGLKGKVAMASQIGGTRIVDMLAGEMLPRIC